MTPDSIKTDTAAIQETSFTAIKRMFTCEPIGTFSSAVTETVSAARAATAAVTE
jgi:hypothetical protein